jgi:hypothetical protein
MTVPEVDVNDLIDEYVRFRDQSMYMIWKPGGILEVFNAEVG